MHRNPRGSGFVHYGNFALCDRVMYLTDAVTTALAALRDYVPQLEKAGATLGYGHHAIRLCEAALKLKVERP